MKYRELQIQTQRESPNNARTEGFRWLVRAGYITRENLLLPLGQRAIARLRELSTDPSFPASLPLIVMGSEDETFFAIEAGPEQAIHCPACKYTERIELAKFRKIPFSNEAPLPLEKVSTPDCQTIEALATMLNAPREKTAKALMYTRSADHQFIFVLVRGDMTLSEAKLRMAVDEVRLAANEEIIAAGAVPGYASPVGLKDVLIVVDDMIPQSPNLIAGANEAGYHLLNTNCGRDYTPEFFADLTLAKAGDTCVNCGEPLTEASVISLATRSGFSFENILLALAETHHDDKGLALPKTAAPYQVYLMHIPGKELDTRARAEEIHGSLENAKVSVLFDDRDERAGVKFNDADLIGCPVRITVGEKNLKEGMVELKPRKERENMLVPIENILEAINKL